MSKDERVEALEREAIIRGDRLYVNGKEVDPMPASAETLPTCDATGPFKGTHCTEPLGHMPSSGHQFHDLDTGARAAWPSEEA